MAAISFAPCDANSISEDTEYHRLFTGPLTSRSPRLGYDGYLRALQLHGNEQEIGVDHPFAQWKSENKWLHEKFRVSAMRDGYDPVAGTTRPFGGRYFPSCHGESPVAPNAHTPEPQQPEVSIQSVSLPTIHPSLTNHQSDVFPIKSSPESNGNPPEQEDNNNDNNNNNNNVEIKTMERIPGAILNDPDQQSTKFASLMKGNIRPGSSIQRNVLGMTELVALCAESLDALVNTPDSETDQQNAISLLDEMRGLEGARAWLRWGRTFTSDQEAFDALQLGKRLYG